MNFKSVGMKVKTQLQQVKAANRRQNISGADALVQCLLEENATLIYGYPGGAIMPVYDSLFNNRNQINHVLTRHEQGAIHAAQGYSRATGKVGVVMATSGPGATNLITGIADAQIDSTPIVCITGQVAQHLLGSEAFQETDIMAISTPVTKWNYQITKASEIPHVLAKAFYIAQSGRPGPVLIDITKNAQFETFEYTYKPCLSIRSYQPKPTLDLNQIKAASELINQANKPLIVFGQGVILGKSEGEFKKFIEKTGIPASCTILGLSALPSNHKRFVGMVGMHGNYAPNMLTNSCDLLIAIGMRFDDRVTGDLNRYAKQAQIIHFDIDPAEIDKNVKTDVAVLGDVKESLVAILPFLKQREHNQWFNQFKALEKLEYSKVIKQDLFPNKSKITMGEVIKEVNAATQGNAIVVSDVGQHQMITCRYAQFKQSKSHITSGGLGTMGFALPAAIGAKLGVPDREVIMVAGDGGYQMTIQELGTILQTKAAVKMIVLNNGYLGMVRQWQEMFFDHRYASTEMTNPDFITIVKGYGIKAKRVKQRQDLKATIEEMIQSKEAYFLEVCVEKEDNVFPMIPTGSSVSEIRLE